MASDRGLPHHLFWPLFVVIVLIGCLIGWALGGMLAK